MKNFVNRYIPTKQMYTDYFSKASKPSKTARIEGYVIAVVSIAGTVLALTNNINIKYVSIFMLGIVGGIVLMNWHIIMAKKYFKEKLRLDGGKIKPVTVEFSSDEINADGKIVSYKRIRKIVEYNGNIFIILGRDIVITVRRDAFISGNAEEFIKFMKAEGFSFENKNAERKEERLGVG